MYGALFLTYFAGIVFFVISSVKNLLFTQLVYRVHSKNKEVEFDYRKKVFWCSFFAEITGFSSMVLLCIIKGESEQNFLLNQEFLPIFTALNSSLWVDSIVPLVGIIVAMTSNFFLTCVFALKNDYYDMKSKQKVVISIITSITNAPYFFFISVVEISINILLCFP